MNTTNKYHSGSAKIVWNGQVIPVIDQILHRVYQHMAGFIARKELKSTS
jgi:hypothetical protein